MVRTKSNILVWAQRASHQNEGGVKGHARVGLPIPTPSRVCLTCTPTPQTKCCILQLICETESRDKFPFLLLSYILFPYLKFLKKGNNFKSYQRSMNKPKMKENRSSNRGSWWLAKDTSYAWRGRGLLISYIGTRSCMEFRFVHGKQMIGDGATRDCAKRTAGARRGRGYPCELLAPARWSLDVCRRWQEDQKPSSGKHEGDLGDLYHFCFGLVRKKTRGPSALSSPSFFLSFFFLS